MTSQLRSILFQVFAYWIQPNKERLNEKIHGKMDIFYGQKGFDVISYKVFFHLPRVKLKKKKDCTKKINGLQHNYEKTNTPTNEGLLRGLNAEARKCNHWATGGLLELGSKFNGTYMYMKCSFNWQPPLALENVLQKKKQQKKQQKNKRPCISDRFLLKSIIKSFPNLKKKKWPPN